MDSPPKYGRKGSQVFKDPQSAFASASVAFRPFSTDCSVVLFDVYSKERTRTLPVARQQTTTSPDDKLSTATGENSPRAFTARIDRTSFPSSFSTRCLFSTAHTTLEVSQRPQERGLHPLMTRRISGPPPGKTSPSKTHRLERKLK